MPKMTLDLAEECIRRIKLKATETGLTLAIAVVDDTGSLVAYVRMGERRFGFGEKVAVAKAKTALAFRRPTQEVLDDFSRKPGHYNIVGLSAMYPGEFWVGPGGIPLTVGGEIIGAVGVAGPSPDSLHQLVAEVLRDMEMIVK